jgi:hypothetical protein
MWSSEKAELKREIKEALITASEWVAVWVGMMMLLINVIF